MEIVQPKLRFPEFNGDWKKYTLEQLTDKVGDGLHGTPEYVDNSDVYFINGNNIIDGKIVINENSKKVSLETFIKNNKGLTSNSILISINGTIGNISRYNNEKIMLGKSVGYFNFKQSKDFYFHILQSNKVQDYFISELTGSTIKNLSLKTLRETNIYQPSLEEQNKIANFLTAVDEKLNLLKEKKSLLEDYKKGIMQKIFNQELRFKDDNGEDFGDWEEKTLGECLSFEQPTKYLVNSTDYNDDFETPVLTAGKTFILGYTDEVNGIFKKEELPVIIFDDFTTATQFVDFPFKAKSSAMKILKAKENVNIKFVYEAMQNLKFEVGGHGRHWISIYSNLYIDLPSLSEQIKIANFLSAIDEKIELVSNQIQDTQEYKKGLLQQMFV
jgi:type I restriction enzyme S subunit